MRMGAPVYYWDDLEAGLVFWGDTVVADRDEMLEYARKNDPQPIHIDEAAALASPHKGLIASGGYTISLWYRTSIPMLAEIAFIAGFDWHIRLPNPVRPGDMLRLKCQIVDRKPSSKPGRGTVSTEQVVMNQRAEAVMENKVVWMIAMRPSQLD